MKSKATNRRPLDFKPEYGEVLTKQADFFEKYMGVFEVVAGVSSAGDLAVVDCTGFSRRERLESGEEGARRE